MSEQTGLPQVVGVRVRDLRIHAERTQDELAAAARRAGLDWGQSSVAALETGRRGLTGEELLLLPLTLTFLDGEKHTLEELLEGAPEMITLASGGRVRRRFLRLLLKGGDTGELAGADIEAVPDVAAGESERHAARVLGLLPEEVARISHHLWGRSLTEERNERVKALADEPGSLRAYRGHVTRSLIDELFHAMQDAFARGEEKGG